jgi:hypothetical protein
MPHRRHAANETEVLPKPFTIPLLNGEVTVNLQPNSSSWVWIVTEYFENISKSFFTTVPDQDGVLEHTELVHISPSSLPAPYDAVEPAWWAEMRSYKELVGGIALESREALSEAQAAIETGRESVERTQHNASVAGAYADESRQSSYDAREYRDEAEQWRNEAQEQADRAASGPESAAQRAEDAAEAAQTSQTRAQGYEDDARNHAAEARSSETNATSAASTATERASDARNEANRAEAEANRAKTYADELMDGPREYVDQAREARDDARDYATDAQTHASSAATSAETAINHADSAETYAHNASSSSQAAQQALNEISEHGQWTEPAYTNGYSSDPDAPFQYRKLNNGYVHLKGRISGGSRVGGEAITELGALPRTDQPIRFLAYSTEGEIAVLRLYDNGRLVWLSGSEHTLEVNEFYDTNE